MHFDDRTLVLHYRGQRAAVAAFAHPARSRSTNRTKRNADLAGKEGLSDSSGTEARNGAERRPHRRCQPIDLGNVSGGAGESLATKWSGATATDGITRE